MAVAAIQSRRGIFRIVTVKKLLRAMVGVVVTGLAVQWASAVEPTWNYAVQVSATVQESPPRITLTWPQDTLGTPGSYTVYRKSPTSSSWGSGTTLSGNTTTYSDTSVAEGTAYEYQVVKAASGYNGYGYICAGINVPLVDSRGKVVLLVDSSVAGSLSGELLRLQQDLVGDGWIVLRHDVSRSDSAANIKNIIKADYNADPANVKSVFIFGHVPVPYSGNIVPDGHYPDHQGAWPADAYYGDMDGTWTDNSVNNTGASDARNRNVPGDGKFDQSDLPSSIELQVGRVDLANMPGRKVWGGPATFPSEIELLRNYLNKDHKFRFKQINPPARAVLYDIFGVRGGEAFAASGYRAYAPMVAGSQTLTLQNNGEWVPYLRDNSCLLAYGSGAGSYTSIGGLGNTGQYNDGTTVEFVENDIKAVFTMLFGSWLGDWDSEDNIMRSVLATPSMGLACSWSGRPHWFYHHIGLGETLGYSARITQNNGGSGLYRNQINSAAGSIHVALMGDPTLRLHPVAPPSNLTASGGTLQWTASQDPVIGYHVYRSANANGPFTRITGSLVTGTSYTDGASGTYNYMVKAIKLQTSPSGTYYNSSEGITTSGSASGTGDTAPPTVSMSAPASGATVSGGSVTLSVNTSDNVGVVGVQFKLDGSNLGAEDTAAPYSISWDTTPIGNGSHSLTAVARDAAGNQATSAPLTVTVSNSGSASNPPPTGAPIVSVVATDANAVEGNTDTATITFTRTGDLSSALTVQYGLDGSATKWNDYRRSQGDMPVSIVIPAGATSATLTVYAWADNIAEGAESFTLSLLADPSYTIGTSRSVTVTINDSTAPPTSGDTTPPTIALAAPTGGAASIGTQINVSANANDNVGVTGVQFRLDGANLGAEDTSSPYSTTWNSTGATAGVHQLSAIARDAAGNRATSAIVSITLTNTIVVVTNSPPPANSSSWVDDALPAGAVAGVDGGDTWTWISSNPTPFSGSKAHQSAAATGLHQHYFDWASATLGVSAGDTLFAYVYLDAANPPNEIMLQWNDGTWEHRAYWGMNNITYGSPGTASRRYVGALPAAGRWVRLEVPASQVGLEDKQVRGMAFTLYGGRATWDVAGKLTASQPPPSGGGTPVVTVLATDPVATEGATDSGVFTFTRTGDLSAPLTVQYDLAGSATKWNDYRRYEGDMPVSIVIPAGAASATLTIYAWPDSFVEGTETCVLTLASNAAYTIGTARSATVSIFDAGATPTGGGTPPPPSGTNTTSVTNTPGSTTNVTGGGTVTNITGGTVTNTPSVPNTPPTPGTAVSVVDNVALQLPNAGDSSLHILSPTVLELELIGKKDPDPAPPGVWNFVDSSFQLNAPAPGEFVVTANGQTIAVQSVGFKRRPLYAPLYTRDLRLDNSLYLVLASPISDGQAVQVRNPSGAIITPSMQFSNVASALRYSPAIHVNQEGYVPNFPKKAMIGHYLGNLGEMTIPTTGGFRIVDATTGTQVFQGSLVQRVDVGYPYTPAPYQKVYEADFSSFTTPGEYRLVVPGLGASLPFLIDNGIVMGFTRAYALGLYHQRCGSSNSLPYTRHTHDACHTAQADVPLPSSSFTFTWNKVAEKSSDYASNPRHTAPQLKDEASQLYPILKRGKIDVAKGHHDAGDYSKYTINTAGLVHYLMFAVDSLAGVADLDNLGLPESGDGISDVMQLAKWEADYLAKLQDDDGGFFFLVYPRDREYENNVTPDHGDPQVVWPKNTAASAAAVAALAQAASSPRFKQTYPAEAAAYLQKAKLGWQFLINAINRYGKDGAYQKITHYGNEFMHDDELAWAAAELFAATGEAQYHQKLKEWFPDPSSPSTFRWGWWRLFEGYGCAVRSYAFAARSGRLPSSQLDSAYLAKCEQQIILCGEDQVSRSEDNAYGTSFPIETKRILSSGWYFSNERAFDIAVAYQLDARTEFLNAFVANMNYEGGCNPVNASYVTGTGWKRQREIVHQYAQNDRRILPPSGIPLGNIQSSFEYLELYKGELNSMCFPYNDAPSARYPFYDRWTDAHNVTTEFVIWDQGRALGGLAFFATLTSAKSTTWKSAVGRIVVPDETSVSNSVTASFVAPGMDLNGARIIWEAKDNEPSYGLNYTFTPRKFGGQWVEVEAQWPDGRRVFAAAELYATNQMPIINVAATVPNASEVGPAPGVFTFTRAGNIASPLTVNYKFSGTAAKWDDYRRPQGDIPESITFPAGASSVTLTIVPVVDGITESTETVILTLQTNAAYNLGNYPSATVTISDSAVKISSLTRSPSTGAVTVTWTSEVGKLYQLKCKDGLAESTWRTLQSNINAVGTSTSFTDSTAGSTRQRFYVVTSI
jgi:hypothetical protein